MQPKLKHFATVLLAMLFAAGCGQKGPLFLPGDPSAIRSTPIPEQDTSADEDEDDEEDDVPPGST